jgi:hypothetical protein
MGVQAGHAISGRNGAVLLDEEIIRPQCVHCNIFLRGNYPEFTIKLIRERAETSILSAYPEYALGDAVQWWESKLLSAKQVKKWTRGELEAKCEEYRTRIAALGS